MRPDQLAEIHRVFWQWRQFPAPCGIDHDHPYNPCMPEEYDRRLLCLTCGFRQRLALEAP